jgi:hypothetical protein
VVLAPRRWRQVLRVIIPKATVARKPGHRGEHGINRKTVVQGMPGCLGEPVVSLLVWFFHFPREAAGALAHPAFPAPSIIEGQRFGIARTPLAPRECGVVSSPMSSHGLTGRPSIPEASALESIGRGVLDAPLSRGMTTEEAP